jgi:hypothetical protein
MKNTNVQLLIDACTRNRMEASGLQTNEAWLIPTWIQMVCPALVCVFVFFLPESPRWLYTHGNPDKAKEILIKYHGEGDANNAFITFQLREFEEQLELNGTDKTVWDYRVGLFKTRADIYRLGCNLVYSCWGQLSSAGLVISWVASMPLLELQALQPFSTSTSAPLF